MISTIKNLILVDETQSLDKIKKQYKSRVYWLLGLSWITSFVLIFIIPARYYATQLGKEFCRVYGNNSSNG